MIHKQRLLNLFFEMVQIDSESGQERKMCDYLSKCLVELGFDVSEDDSNLKTGYTSGNIFAKTSGEGPSLLFTCHMDTVKPGRGIKPRIEGDYIVSDGTTILGSDDKAGLAALLEGLQVWKEKYQQFPPLELVLTVGEEEGLVGARHFDPKQLKSRYGFALDSDGEVGTIVMSTPAQAVLHVTIHGKSAHAGLAPERGISAIQIASRAISQMCLGRIDSETTANIGRFQGGSASNIVPDYVEILAEARSHNEAKLKAQVEHMERTFIRIASKYGGLTEILIENPHAGFKFTEDDKVVQHVVKAMKDMHCTPHFVASGGASDANILSSYGVPTINCGVGYENVHTTKERMPLSQLYKSASLVVALLEANK